MFGEDANWGRMLCAIGYTPGDVSTSAGGCAPAQPGRYRVECAKTAPSHPFSEEEAAKVLKEKEIDILVDMKSGSSSAKAWGCDLTYDYVKINGDYRT